MEFPTDGRQSIDWQDGSMANSPPQPLHDPSAACRIEHEAQSQDFDSGAATARPALRRRLHWVGAPVRSRGLPSRSPNVSPQRLLVHAQKKPYAPSRRTIGAPHSKQRVPFATMRPPQAYRSCIAESRRGTSALRRQRRHRIETRDVQREVIHAQFQRTARLAGLTVRPGLVHQ